jgi:hypothetical protein
MKYRIGHLPKLEYEIPNQTFTEVRVITCETSNASWIIVHRILALSSVERHVETIIKWGKPEHNASY